jgi:hypothetical protein
VLDEPGCSCLAFTNSLSISSIFLNRIIFINL